MRGVHDPSAGDDAGQIDIAIDSFVDRQAQSALDRTPVDRRCGRIPTDDDSVRRRGDDGVTDMIHQRRLVAR